MIGLAGLFYCSSRGQCIGAPTEVIEISGLDSIGLRGSRVYSKKFLARSM